MLTANLCPRPILKKAPRAVAADLSGAQLRAAAREALAAARAARLDGRPAVAGEVRAAVRDAIHQGILRDCFQRYVHDIDFRDCEDAASRIQFDEDTRRACEMRRAA